MKGLSGRMLIISCACALVLTGAFVALILAIQAQRSAAHQALRSQQALTNGQALEKSVVNLESGVRGYVATDRQGALEPFVLARTAYPAQLRRLGRLVADVPQERARIGRIRGEIADYVHLWALPLIALARERPDAARDQLANVTGPQRIDAIRRDFAGLFARERSVAAASQAGAQERGRVATWLGAGGIALVLGLAVALALYLRRSVIAPIKSVAHATEAVAGGDLSTRVADRRQDELGVLARGFNEMTGSLRHSRAALDERTAELERSNRDLRDFAAVASHDIQGPLSTISLLAQVLGRRLGNRGEDAELAGDIGQVTGRLRELVRDLLDYARLDRRPLRERPVALDDVVHQALASLTAPIEAAGARISVDPLPTVYGDPVRLRQVVQNLVANAVKFSDGRTPRVEIKAIRSDGRCRLSVDDNGIGFGSDEAERIFRPFQRLHSSDLYEGSGIGLAICERIVLQHGGRIWAESREGAGTSFHVELVLAEHT